MSFVASTRRVVTSVREFFSPNLAIGQVAPRASRNQPLRPPSLASRLLHWAHDTFTRPRAKKASEPIPFGDRFQLLVFSMRLKFAKSPADLQALKNEVKEFRKDVEEAKGFSNKSLEQATVSPTVGAVEGLLTSIKFKLFHADGLNRIPPATGPIYGGW